MLKKLAKNMFESSLVPDIVKEEPWSLFRIADTSGIRLLKNKYQDQRVVIIGNGPSLNKIDFGLLKQVKTISFNSIFLKKDFQPYIYMVEDGAVARENAQAVSEVKARYKFFPTAYKKILMKDKGTLFFNMNRGMYEKDSANFEMPRFSSDFSKRAYCGQSVTIIGLQLAYYLGFSEVGLVGMDFNYTIPDSTVIDGHNYLSTGEDPNHFDSRYFGAGKTWHDPKLHNVEKSYKLSKIIYEGSGREIVNCSVGGKLDVFRRQNLEEFIGCS